MSEAGKVWKPIKSHAPGLWRRIEDRVGRGTPDCIYAMQGLGCGLAELKYLQRIPKGVSTLGLSKPQVMFLNKFAAAGGLCHLIARAGDTWLIVRGEDVVFQTTWDGWVQRSVFHGENLPWDNLESLLSAKTMEF